MIENILYIVAAYLIGSIPFGYLAGRLNGIDLREHGSHNIGATNAVRVLGKKWGIPVFICDFLKGFLPLLFVKEQLGGTVELFDSDQMAWLLGVLAALILGHTYTCFLGFKGGKGVATTAGCLFALSLPIGLAVLVTWVVGMVLTRYVSLSSMLAAVAMVTAAVQVFWLEDGDFATADAMVITLLFLVCILVVFKHRSNITRLCNGTEPKAFSKKN